MHKPTNEQATQRPGGTPASHPRSRLYPLQSQDASPPRDRLVGAHLDDTPPGFSPVAARHGVRSMKSMGMPVPQRIVSGINVHRFDEPLLDLDSRQLAELFAGDAAIALGNHSLHASSTASDAHLRTAMRSRAVIDETKGIMTARLHSSPDKIVASA